MVSSRRGRQPILAIATVVTLALLSGCFSFAVSPAKRVVGLWQTDLGGFPVEVLISEEQVQVLGQEPVPYTLEEDTMLLASDEYSRLQIEFPSRNVMLQRNLSTGEVQQFTRVTGP